MDPTYEDLLAQLTNLNSGAKGNNDSYRPTQWGANPYSGPGDSSGTFDPNGGKPDFMSLLSMFGGGNKAGGSGPGWLQNSATAVNGIAQLGGLYLGIKQLGLAKDQFKLQKQAYKTNLANQTSAYNTQIGDRIAGRNYNTEEERQAALRAAQLPTTGY